MYKEWMMSEVSMITDTDTAMSGPSVLDPKRKW